MNKKQLNRKLEEGTAFLDIDYGDGDIQIYHDVVEDRYYLSEDNGKLAEVYLAVEKRYTDATTPDEDELFDDPSIDYDVCGEFDEMIETSGDYVYRYGYFKYVHKDTIIPITRLIDYTKIKMTNTIIKGKTFTEYLELYGPDWYAGNLWDFPKSELEDGSIEPQKGMVYWEIEDRLFETGEYENSNE